LSYQVITSRQAERELKRLPQQEAERIGRALLELEESPLPRGATKLGGTPRPLWRIRVGEYRVIYSVIEASEQVLIEQILRRGTQTYRRLNR